MHNYQCFDCKKKFFLINVSGKDEPAYCPYCGTVEAVQAYHANRHNNVSYVERCTSNKILHKDGRVPVLADQTARILERFQIPAKEFVVGAFSLSYGEAKMTYWTTTQKWHNHTTKETGYTLEGAIKNLTGGY